VLQIAEIIRDLAGSSSPIQFMPPSEDDPRRRCPDITLAHEKLGWQPTVPYREGLAVTLEWFCAQLDTTAPTSGVLQGS
jgi:dTDP-glucose 4,6-dehydratase